MALHHAQVLQWQEPPLEDAEKLQSIFHAYEEREEKVMLGWARREPQLFRVLLGPEFGPQAIEHGTEPNECQFHNTAGTFAMFAATIGYSSVIQELLESGLHPDDRAVFISQPLIHYPQWRYNPKSLSQALSCSADATALLLKMAREPNWSTGDRRLCDLLLLEFGARYLPAGVEDEIRKRLPIPPSAREQALLTEVVMRAKIRQQPLSPAAEEQAMAFPPQRRRKCV